MIPIITYKNPLLILVLSFVLFLALTQRAIAAFPVVEQQGSLAIQYHTPAIPTKTTTAQQGSQTGEDGIKSGLSIASFALGLFGLAAIPIGFLVANLGALAVAGGVAALLAIIFGAIGRSGEKNTALGTIGMILGILEIGALIVIGLFVLIFLWLFFN
jgi:hypothetical protein